MTVGRLAPAVAGHLAELAAQGALNLSRLDAVSARVASAAGQALGTQEAGPTAPMQEWVLTLPGRDLPARVYLPPGHQEPTGLPVLVWYHGGGFVLGDLDSADQLCSFLATQTGAAVVSVGYRLAPEHPWPAAHLDAVDALEWVYRNAAGLGLDGTRLAVAGDSAGATLAAAAARGACDLGIELAHQVLFYPVVSTGMDSGSYAEFRTGFGLLRDEMEWFFQHYGVLGEPARREFDTVLATPDAGLAPIHLVSAECDVLRDEGEGYAAAALAAGVEVTAVRYLGVPHGFIQMTGVTAQAEAALSAASRVLRRALHPR